MRVIVEPAPEQSSLANLCLALGLHELPPPQAHISQVSICPTDNTWSVYITGDIGLDDIAVKQLANKLASVLCLAGVTLVPVAASPVVEDAANVTATIPAPTHDDDDDTNLSDAEYLAALAQRQHSRLPTSTLQPDENRPTDEVLLGHHITQAPQPINAIRDEERSVVIRGSIVVVNVRDLRSGKRMVSFDVTDTNDTITVKVFTEEQDSWVDRLHPGMWLLVQGPVQYDKFTQELTLLPRDVMAIPTPPGRTDNAEHKRVELHLHTKMSALDGVADIHSVVAQAAAWGHPAIAITDHGVVQAFPEAYKAGQEHAIKVIYGVEGYLVDNPKEHGRTYHVIILAATQEGIRNLYELVSLAHLDHFYRKPRIPRSELVKRRSGLLLGSACEAGELYQALISGIGDTELDAIAAFYDYLEVQPLANNRFLIDTGRVESEETLRHFTRRILASGKRLGKTVVATSDAHYLHPEDDIYRRILMAGHGFADNESPAPLFMKTTIEMLTEFGYLGEADAFQVVVQGPQQVADMVGELRPIPAGFFPPHLQGAEEQIRTMSEQNARKLYGNPLPELVAQRLERELNSIIGNGFASLYLIAHKLIKQSVDDGYMVGSRGSVGSSLVALLCGISEVNPLPPHYSCPSCWFFVAANDTSIGAGPDLSPRNCPNCGQTLHRDGFDIPFETFLGFEGDKTPDIDLNFSGEYQPRAHKYTEELFGKENVFRAGTIGTLADKTAYGYVRKFMDEKGLSARSAEMNRLALGLTGTRKTTGQHPGGIIVVPQGRSIFEFSPVQHPANDKESGIITTHFAFDYIHDQLLKLDILGHDGPTMIRLLVDFTGVQTKDIPLDDARTMEIFSGLNTLGISRADAGGGVGTLGIPEYNTRFVRQMLEDTRPATFADLVRIMGLSHGIDVWLNNNQDLVRNRTITMAETIACRDDIMGYLMRHGLPAKLSFKLMEQVRKGFGLSSDDEKAMLDHSIPRWYVESCKKISYMFPKAHAAAYAIMAFWQAYFKVHYPMAFYAAYFSVRADEFDAQLVLQGKLAVQQALLELDAKGNDATGKEKGQRTVLEVVVEAMARGVGFLPVHLYESQVRHFMPMSNGLRPPLIALQGVGISAAESIAEARANKPFTSIEDMKKQAGISKSVVEVLSAHGCLAELPPSDQMRLF